MVIFVTLFVIFTISSAFLQEYYIYRQRSEFVSSYNQVCGLLEKENINMMNELSNICSDMNINIVLSDRNFNEIYTSTNMLNNPIKPNTLRETLRSLHSSVKIDSSKGYGMRSFEIDKRGEMLILVGELTENYYIFFVKPIIPIIRSISIYIEFFLYISIVIAILSAIAAYFISAVFSRPIHELVDISQRIAKLDFSKKYVPKGTSDINQLGLSLNEMSDKLSENIVQLYRANTILKNDITQKERNEQMRKEFLQNASHELKTPISVIASYTEMLKDKLITDEKDREYYYDVIYEETEKMTVIVKEMLMLAQFESQSNILNIEAFNLTEVVEDVLETYSVIAKKENIDIVSDVENDIFISADMLMIERAMSNYISNAIYHVKDDDKIFVSLKKIDGGIRFSVKNKTDVILDNSKIWTSFYKGDESKGNGLGLSIVKAVMESHNKKYGVKCEEGYAEFFFIL